VLSCLFFCAGVPFGVTIDFDTVNQEHDDFNSVTLRDRDTQAQFRIPVVCFAVPRRLVQHFVLSDQVAYRFFRFLQADIARVVAELADEFITFDSLKDTYKSFASAK